MNFDYEVRNKLNPHVEIVKPINGDEIESKYLSAIFLHLNSQDLANCNGVCRKWRDVIDAHHLWNEVLAKEIHQYADFVFGKEEWNKYFGKIGNVPNYPRNIGKVLASNCPYFKGQTVGKTHLLVLVPETVKGKPLTIKFLGKLAKNPKKGNKTGYNKRNCLGGVFEEHGKIPVKKAYWILITKEIIPNSRQGTITTDYSVHHKLVTSHAHYNVPRLLDAILAAFIKRVSCGEYLLPSSPFINTSCREESYLWFRTCVGHYDSKGLVISDMGCSTGVMACRYFDVEEDESTKVTKSLEKSSLKER